MDSKRVATRKKKKSVRTWLILLIAALLLFAIAMVLVTVENPSWYTKLFGGSGTSQTAQSAASGDAVPAPSAPAQAAVDATLEFSINTQPTFENGAAEGDLALGSSSGNQYDMQLRVVLEDTGETVYTSAVLAPGESAQTAALSTALEAGEYSAVGNIDVLDADGTVLNTLTTPMTLTVNG